MDWRWILVQAVGAALVWLFAAARSRSSMQTYANDLRRAAREMSLQSQQLTSVREAAKESKKESQRRAIELKTLRDRIAHLTETVTTVTAERDQARSEAASLHARVADLTTRLARSDVRREGLEKEVAAASLVRLELQSKLRTDETQRLSALNRLRQPRPPAEPAAPRSPVHHFPSDSRALSPLPVAKSPSESCLLTLQPDLALSDSDDDVDFRALEEKGRELEQRMARSLAESDRLLLHARGGTQKLTEVPAVELGRAAVSAGIPRQEDMPAVDIVKQENSGKELSNAPVDREEQGTAHVAPVQDGKAPMLVGTPANVQDPAEEQAKEPAVREETKTSSVSTNQGTVVVLADDVNKTAEPLGAAFVPAETPKSTEELGIAAVVVDEKGTSPVCTAVVNELGGAPRLADELVGAPFPGEDLDTVHLPSEKLGEAPVLAEDVDTVRGVQETLGESAYRSGLGGGVDATPASEDDVKRRTRGELDTVLKETDFLRGGVSQYVDPTQLSLNRAPWLDTLNPLLQTQSDSMSISSALRPLFTQDLSGIVWCGVRTRPRRNNGDQGT